MHAHASFYTRQALLTLRSPMLLAAALLAALAWFASTPAAAQPDLVISRVVIQSRSAAYFIRGAWRFAAQADVTVNNIATSIVDGWIPAPAAPVTLHFVAARAQSWTTRRSYAPVPLYNCDFVSDAACDARSSHMRASAPIPPGSSRTYSVQLQLTGVARDWADPTRPLEGEADFPLEDIACAFFADWCFFAETIGGRDLRGFAGCTGGPYCYSIIVVVNRDNPIGEVAAGRGNNIFIGRFRVRPQPLRPLGP